MLSNYYILHHVVRELRDLLVGETFRGAYSVHAGELMVCFDNDCVLTVILNPAHATLFVRTVEHAGAPRKNSISFFDELSGKHVTDIVIAHDDKLVSIVFDEYQLVFRFYNSPNALLLRGDEIVSTFKKEPSTERAASKFVATGIRQMLPMLGKQLESEFVARYPQCDHTNEKQLRDCATEFDSLLRNSNSLSIYKRADDFLLAPIDLHSIRANMNTWVFERQESSPSKAISETLAARRKLQSLSDRKKSIRSRLETIAGRTRKAAADAQSGLATSERAARHRAIADAISVVAHELPKGSNEIRYDFEGESLVAPLDEKLSAYENVAKYYDKARKSEHSKAELAKKLSELTQNTAIVESLIAELDSLGGLREVDTFEKSLRARSFLLERSDETAERSGDDLDRFRRYRVAGGFEVLAGKSAKQNDELTMRIATKEDLWFHARHVAGSHVVLRVAGRTEIPREAIEQAASIAALFSDAKNQSLAPVAYTKRKFVRKRKGAALGAVVVEREEVIMVEPKEPS